MQLLWPAAEDKTYPMPFPFRRRVNYSSTKSLVSASHFSSCAVFMPSRESRSPSPEQCGFSACHAPNSGPPEQLAETADRVHRHRPSAPQPEPRQHTQHYLPAQRHLDELPQPCNPPQARIRPAKGPAPRGLPHRALLAQCPDLAGTRGREAHHTSLPLVALQQTHLAATCTHAFLRNDAACAPPHTQSSVTATEPSPSQSTGQMPASPLKEGSEEAPQPRVPPAMASPRAPHQPLGIRPRGSGC